jgi:HD-like signal output (HDOD) protein
MPTTTAELEDLVDSTVSIPTVPRTLMEINRIFSDPEGSAKEAAALISQDPPIAAKVLRLANSSFYGARNPVSSIQLAISVLGMRILRNIVVQATVLEHLKGGADIGRFGTKWLWDHSFKVATAMHELSVVAKGDHRLKPDDAYTCGLLHDMGKILLLESAREQFAEALECSLAEQVPLHQAETRILGFTHADVGSLLCDRWKLPPRTVSAVRYHHAPGPTPDELAVGSLVAAANALAHECSDGGGYTGTRFTREMAEALGLGPAEIERIQTVVKASTPDA